MSNYVCFAVYCLNVILSGISLYIVSLIISTALKREDPNDIFLIAFDASLFVVSGLILWIMKLYGYL